MKNKLTSLFLSVVLAFGLWLYVVTTVSQGDDYTFYNIPVVMEGESVLNERNLMITSVSSTNVTMVISGNRSDLAKVNSSNITLKADLSKITEPGERVALNYSHAFPGNVASNALVVESKSPSSIYVTVEERRNKEVPVEILWIGSAPEGFMSDRENRILDYSSITVMGPASVADRITKAVIEVNLNEQRESISQSYRYTLCDEAGEPVDAELITTNVDAVRLDVKIQQVKEVPLKLDVTYGAGATQENTKIEIRPETIRLSGGEAVLEELGEAIVLGKINLTEVSKSQELTYTITLPEGVTNLSGVTEATVNIRFSGLVVKEFVVDNITAVNVPEGMEAELISEKLTVTVRGPAAEISRLEAEDIKVTVDFSDAKEGTSTYKAIIQLPEGFGASGAMKADPVAAEVKET